MYSVLELCAGAGGQAIGLAAAGFEHAALVDNDPSACQTLRANVGHSRVIEADLRGFDGKAFRGIDLVAAGVPCPPFSIAGKQLGQDDSRDLFPTALRVIEETEPAAAIIENVPGFASQKFSTYRRNLAQTLWRLGYDVQWQILNACQYGVPQLRPRFVLVAMRPRHARRFEWPRPVPNPPTVGEVLRDMMAERGWSGAGEWAERARGIAPTLVGGSKLHGGPDLGPTRARAAWKELGVDGRGVADLAPDVDFPVDGLPRLTVRMAARIQGIPDEWLIVGKKTAAYRQVGNAFPPPVAHAVGAALISALEGKIAVPYGEQTALFSEVG